MKTNLLQIAHGDWPEDFSHENGNYTNQCIKCQGMFTGHKRRCVCKTCAYVELLEQNDVRGKLLEAIKEDCRKLRSAIAAQIQGSDAGSYVLARLNRAGYRLHVRQYFSNLFTTLHETKTSDPNPLPLDGTSGEVLR